MVLLTTLLTPLAILISWSIEKNVRAYMALFLLLETGMLGVFMALDLFLFFVFWEIGLVPMYFLINQWGSEKGERNLARPHDAGAHLCLVQVPALHHGRLAGPAAGDPDDRHRPPERSTWW